jgi:L-threonylcarbamoyladenylate synthase
LEGLTKDPNIIDVTREDRLRTGLEKAKRILLDGGLVAFPTESFYGLAANAMDEKAIQRLFAIKNRKNDLPVLILIHDPGLLHLYVKKIPETAASLMKRFWPGGLTLLFEAGNHISPLLTAGTGKIGIRISSHPIATALARSINGPITGTSANISGRPACINAEEVFDSLGNGIDLILDGGGTKGGKGSAILDITQDPPAVIREGMIGEEEIYPYI